jgi:hypothetical protein
MLCIICAIEIITGAFMQNNHQWSATVRRKILNANLARRRSLMKVRKRRLLNRQKTFYSFNFAEQTS